MDGVGGAEFIIYTTMPSGPGYKMENNLKISLRFLQSTKHKSFIPSEQLLNIFLLFFGRIRKKKYVTRQNNFYTIVTRRQKDEQEKQISPFRS